MEAAAGFVRITHRRCEDCDIREDLHASGTAIPKRRHRIAACKTCGGKGEIVVFQLKDRIDPYAKPPKGWREEHFAKRRKIRAAQERTRFDKETWSYLQCELLMQIPPSGFNHGRASGEELQTKYHQATQAGMRIDAFEPRSPRRFRPVETIRHGTRAAYVHDRCRCDLCRLANASYHALRRAA